MRRQPYDPSRFLPWSKFSGVVFDAVTVSQIDDERGLGVKATGDLQGLGPDGTGEHRAQAEGDEEQEEGVDRVVMTVPKDLILSPGLVEEHGKLDTWLREVIDAVGDFGKTPRYSVLIFILLQLTHTTPDLADVPKVGVSHPLTKYILSLPNDIPVPTLYTDSEREILYGTSLADAVDQKLEALSREFEHLRESTEEIGWCRKVWWGEPSSEIDDAVTEEDSRSPLLTFHDWLVIDSMYRSRALDLPGTGNCMVPCIDMANHASITATPPTTALYETDLATGSALLQIIDEINVRNGQEITISYGDDKGASEMVYSYGFIEQSMNTAGQLFLDLDIPDDDPLRRVKREVCGEAPGVRIFERHRRRKHDTNQPSEPQTQDNDETVPENQDLNTNDHNEPNDDSEDDLIDWESPFLYWSTINHTDGLDFQILQENPDPSQSPTTFTPSNPSPLEPPIQTLIPLLISQPFCPRDLLPHLRQSPKFPLYHLRALTLLHSRVSTQLSLLSASEEPFMESKGGWDIEDRVWTTVRKLRDLESGLLGRFQRKLGKEIGALSRDEVVVEYLANVDKGGDGPGDGAKHGAEEDKGTENGDEGGRRAVPDDEAEDDFA